MSERTLAIVLSGGGMNGLLLELGFLRRLREDPLWESVGWIYGTSAGALTGVMAVVDRLDALERFVLQLAPDETFRPNRLWQLPLTGLHEYALPDTIAERLMPIDQLARDVVEAPIELVVCVTDVSDGEIDEKRAYERLYSSRTTDPDELARAILASAAISALVFPLRVGDVIGTDGGWVRNFPLGHAYDNPAVGEIVGFQYIPRPSRVTGENLGRLRRRLEPFRAVPPVRALLEEVRAAEERQQRGEPGHLAEMIGRLMRVTVARNTTLEVRSAEAKDASVRELEGVARRHPGLGAAQRQTVETRTSGAGGGGAVRGRALPVPPRPRPAADDRPRERRRARARPGLPVGPRVARGDKTRPHRPRPGARGRDARAAFVLGGHR